MLESGTTRRRLNLALAVLGAAAFAWRLVGLDAAPFINDEPQFLAAARDQLVTGRVLTRSIIVGTSGYFYGGAIFWFYGLLQWAGATALGCLRSMTLTVTLAQAFFGLALARRFVSPGASLRALLRHDRGWALGALWLLLASSPHQHFWSRLAWDQLTDAVSFVVAGLACSVPDRGVGRAAGIGALLGFGLSSHPMIAPFALVAGLSVSLGDGRFTWRGVLSRALALGTSALVVLAPWLYELWLQRDAQPTFSHGTPLTLERALEVFRAPGVEGISYFFDHEWPLFLASPFGPPAWAPLSAISTGLWVALVLAGLLLALATPSRRLALTALATLVAYPVFYASRGIPVQPHYQFPTGWAPLVTVAVLLTSRFVTVRRVTLVVVLLLSAWQLDFVRRWTGWIAGREGTRGPHYAVTLREQQRVVDAICAKPGPVVVSLEIVAFAPSFEFLAAGVPGCAPTRVRWCGAGRGCAGVRPDETVARVGYAAAEGARLGVSFSR